jgi:hypothetical protein
MKNLILTVLGIVLLLTSCDNGKIGKYKKEPLPSNFSYNILEDKSNLKLEKNQLTIEISQKLTEGQIATLAEELFNSKEKQRRFYIFYQLSRDTNASGAWATSHFDPELEIQIIGSSTQQDETVNKVASEQIDGDIIGKWKEEQYTSSINIIYKKDNKTFIKTIYKDGQNSEVELTEKKVEKGIRYNYKKGGYNGEYYILNTNGDLEFYNNENKNFTTATKTN